MLLLKLYIFILAYNRSLLKSLRCNLKYGYTLEIGSHVHIHLANGLWFVIYNLAIHSLYLEIIQSNSKVMDWIFMIEI